MRCSRYAVDQAFVAVCAAAAWVLPVPASAAGPEFGPAAITLCGKPAPPGSLPHCGLTFLAGDAGPQLLLTQRPATGVACVRAGEELEIALPIRGVQGSYRIEAQAENLDEGETTVSLWCNPERVYQSSFRYGTIGLAALGEGDGREIVLHLKTAEARQQTAVRWHNLRLLLDDRTYDIPLWPAQVADESCPPRVLPALREPLQQALVEWDWRMQDGIETERLPSTLPAAVQRTLERGDRLLADLRAAGVALAEESDQWQDLHQQCADMTADASTGTLAWQDLWRRVHSLRRKVSLQNPLAQTGPIALLKQVPAAFSHQLTQYYGRYARPGGGLFVLDRPGTSMDCRPLAGGLPAGSCQHLEVAYAGDRILFAYCRADTPPPDPGAGQHGRYYHLYEVRADGSGLRQLTDGPYDDFAPRCLPDGPIVFISTRRQGWHRCGSPGCENYTLAVAKADGSDPHPISYHETQEWDPAVLSDGRIVYTRWDYVDRHAVYYEQLWTVRPDGTAPATFYGNNTFNPVGLWEAQAVPGSRRVMATAAAHHAMTAGSIVLVDVTKGVDGPGSLTRLTPDALFPESEAPVLPHWQAPAGGSDTPVPPEAQRWPGHCYRTPCPLSETYFLAAYSFDPLWGEPKPNRVNMFGIYLVDRFGNKELLYRDLSIASLWPVPLRARARPPVLTPVSDRSSIPEGTYFLQNVYAATPPLPRGAIRRLRIVQVVPKSTPGINRPAVGLPNASPGKQVLGTVPVESDGSAFFRAPAGVPLMFQALDERGQAVQVMRSVTYLQPGENAACVGCHEPRTSAPPLRSAPLAMARAPSAIAPGPDGSRPLSYPLLVQPLLDQKCVSCHNPDRPEGKVILTGQPQGHYTVSYNALAPRVPYSAWGGRPGDFRQVNSEPTSRPDFFGARGSKLMQLLLAGHEKVVLSADEIERLATWMDANALFYGTFDPDDQARQQRGERIAGPKLQ